jgi:DNA invertase Pin-like site-specific DNA recombinase
MAPALVHQPPRALGYCRVSTGDQMSSGAGLDAQRAALQAEADRRGWALELILEDGLSAKDLNRPALVAALSRLDRGEADLLMVSKLDRLSRSVKDFGGLLERASKRNWSVLCLDLGVDTTTPVGEFTANVVVSASQYERRLIGQRTKDALAARKAAGVKLGRPRSLSDAIVGRIVEAQGAGQSLSGIARELTNEGVPTAQGGRRWYASTVAAVLRSVEADVSRGRDGEK